MGSSTEGVSNTPQAPPGKKWVCNGNFCQLVNESAGNSSGTNAAVGSPLGSHNPSGVLNPFDSGLMPSFSQTPFGRGADFSQFPNFQSSVTGGQGALGQSSHVQRRLCSQTPKKDRQGAQRVRRAPNHVVQASQRDFKEKVLKASDDKIVVAKFGANGRCAPCRALEAQLEKLSKDKRYAGKIQFVSIDADKNPALFKKYCRQGGTDPKGVPMTRLFYKGKPLGGVLSGNKNMSGRLSSAMRRIHNSDGLALV